MRLRFAFCAAAVLASSSIVPTGLDDDGGAVLVFVATIFALGSLGRPTTISAVVQVVLGALLLVVLSTDVRIENWILLAAFANSAFAIGRRLVRRTPDPSIT